MSSPSKTRPVLFSHQDGKLVIDKNTILDGFLVSSVNSAIISERSDQISDSLLMLSLKTRFSPGELYKIDEKHLAGF